MANTVSNEENENDSDSLGLFELLESRTFDYLSLFQRKKKKEKSNSRSVRWIEKKESRWNSRWTKWTREETPSPPWNASCPSRRHPPSFRFIPHRVPRRFSWTLAIYLDIITIDETSAIFWSIDVFRWFSAVREPSLALKTWADMGWYGGWNG